MDSTAHDKVMVYVRNQLAQADSRLYAYTVDVQDKPYVKREAGVAIEQYIRDYQKEGSEPRWVTLVGLRGVGKTTLMAQMYRELQCEQNRKLYISVDEIIRVLGVSLEGVLTVYEEVLGVVFEKLETPVYIFLDEVHHEKKWESILKSLYDRSKKVFILMTGSAALLLQSDADSSRRKAVEKLLPLSFPEFMLIKEGKVHDKSLSAAIKQSVFNATNAEGIYTQLQTLQQDVTNYWLGIDRLAIDTYLRFATLPFALQFKNEALIYDQIEKSLTNIIATDIVQLKKFDNVTIAKISKILYALSGADIVSLKKMSETFDIAINTLIEVLDTCAKAELLLRVYPNGAHYSQVRKPSKYLFLSSAYRSMFFNLIGSQASYEQYKGFLLEDVIGLYLYRILANQIGTAMTYDNGEGGADFIINLHGKKIPLEVGHGAKGYMQVEETKKRIGADYGIVVSSSPLGVSEDKTMISIPLEYFLLM